MDATGSVTFWIGRVKDGDEAALRLLWSRYYRPLVRVARRRLRGAGCRVADEEDVALDAFDSFFRGASAGRFADLRDRADLWQILLTLAARKAVNLYHHEHREKRRPPGADAGGPPPPLDGDAAAAPGPTPEFLAEAAEEFARRLLALGDDTLREIALWKMEGYTVEEIARRLGCVPRTVERKLHHIRATWGGEA